MTSKSPNLEHKKLDTRLFYIGFLIMNTIMLILSIKLGKNTFALRFALILIILCTLRKFLYLKGVIKYYKWKIKD